VLEASDRPGGVVGTFEHNGFRFEEGPNTVMASALGIRQLAHDVGLDDRVVASDQAAKDRFLYFKGRLRTLPSGLGSFVATPLLSMRAKLRLATEPFRRHVSLRGDELEPNLEAFLGARLGLEAARVLAGSFVRGVYAAELQELGAKSAFPKLWNLAEQHGGFVRGALAKQREPKPEVPGPEFPRGSLLSFELGLVELVEALSRELGPRLSLNTRVSSLERHDSAWRIVTATGRELRAARVVLAVPAPVAARLLGTVAGASSLPLDVLTSIPHGRITLVHLGFERGALPQLPNGFGYLVPPGGEQVTGAEAPAVLGTIFVSKLFRGRAPEGFEATTSFYRSEDIEALLGTGADDARILQLAARDLARAVGAPHAPELRTGIVRRWDEVIPRYAPGHERRVGALLERLRSELPGIELAGNFVAGVSVDYVVARGRAVAEALVAQARDREQEVGAVSR